MLPLLFNPCLSLLPIRLEVHAVLLLAHRLILLFCNGLIYLALGLLLSSGRRSLRAYLQIRNIKLLDLNICFSPRAPGSIEPLRMLRSMSRESSALSSGAAHGSRSRRQSANARLCTWLCLMAVRRHLALRAAARLCPPSTCQQEVREPPLACQVAARRLSSGHTSCIGETNLLHEPSSISPIYRSPAASIAHVAHVAHFKTKSCLFSTYTG